VLSETNDIGVSVIDTMQQQRESLLRSRDKVGNTNSLTERARGIMRLMQARTVTNKALLIFVVLLLLAMIGVVVYFGWVKDPAK
jgi:vesicle transport through interaction with t-SNAREs protein 1